MLHGASQPGGAKRLRAVHYSVQWCTNRFSALRGQTSLPVDRRCVSSYSARRRLGCHLTHLRARKAHLETEGNPATLGQLGYCS